MATELIHTEWKTAVCAILRSQDKSKIRIVGRAYAEFSALFPNAWDYNLYELLERYLSRADAIGRLITDLKPPGIGYAFICEYDGEKVYAKLNLLASGDVVLIISAHRPDPEKGDVL